MTPVVCKICAVAHRGTCAQHLTSAVINRASMAVCGDLPAARTATQRAADSRAKRQEEYKAAQRARMKERRKKGKA